MIAPITMDVINKDHQKWLDIMFKEDTEDRSEKQASVPPSLAQVMPICRGIKYRFDDLRNSFERSSARNYHASCC